MTTKRKTGLCYFLQLSIFLLIFSCLGTRPSMADGRAVAVGVYENAPKVFTSEAGKPSGIFIDVIEEIAKVRGWNLRYVNGTWAEGLDRLAKGQIDLMPDVAYTTDREKIYSFHKVPVLSVWSQVYARKGSGIQSILDLNGKRITALEQTIQLETFHRLTNSFGLKIELIPVPDYKTGFEMVANKKADAAVSNRFYGLMYARKFSLEDTPIMFDPAPFFFAAQKGDPKKLLDTIDSRLSDLKKDPQSAYYASLKRWTSEEVKFKIPIWLKVLALVFVLTLLLSVAGALILKHQVNARTRELNKINDDLCASEQRYRELFERNPAPMLIYEPATMKMLAVNEAFTRHYGYSSAQALSMGLTDLFPEEEKARITDLAARLKGRVYAGELYHVKSDGSIITVVAKSHEIDYFGRDARVVVISDITERKRTEEALVESERRFRTLFEQAAVGVAEIDPISGRFINVNKRYCDIVGLSFDEMLKTNFQSITHPDDLQADLKNMKLLVKGEVNEFSMEKRYIKKDGGIVWVNLTVYPTWLSGESPTRHIAIVEDITERKLAENALRHSEEKFFKAFHATPDAIVITRAADGLLLEVNDVFVEQTGYSREEALNKTVLELKLWHDQHARRRYIDEVRQHGRVREMEARFRMKSGNVLDSLVSGESIVLNNEVCLLTIIRDVTERKKTEDALRAREAQLSLIYDDVHDIIFVIGVEPDDHFRFVSVNRRFLEATGLSENQVVGKPVQDIIPEAASSLVLAKYHEAVQSGRPVHWEEVSIYPAGKKFGEVTVAPVFDAANKCMQLIGTVHDITDLKLAQEELEQRVIDRTRDLSQANIRLQELDRLKSMFIATMSHELRTPLNSIIGFTGMTLQGLSGQLNDEQKDNISRVYQSAKHLLSLISDIIDISKIEAGRIEAFPETVSLKEIVDEAIGAVKPQLQEKGLALAVDVPSDVGLTTDRKRLLQCLLNFLSNAVKFTQSGTITIAAGEADGQVELSVSDTGIGISEKDMPKLFAAFERLDTHLSVKAGGTGLGLYLTKKIAIDILHGDVTVQSKEGQGSTFTLRVPKGSNQDFEIAKRTGDIR